MKSRYRLFAAAPLVLAAPLVSIAAAPEWAPVVKARAEAEYASLFEI